MRLLLILCHRKKECLGFPTAGTQKALLLPLQKTIDDQTSVRVFSAPVFITTKLEAFKNSGNGDGRTSSDFEDIVYVLENREIIWEEMKATSSQLKEYLRSEFTGLLQNPYCQEWIGANSDAYPPSSDYIMSEMRNVINQ